MVGPFPVPVFDLGHTGDKFPGRAARGMPDDSAGVPLPRRAVLRQANRGKSWSALPRSTAERCVSLKNPGALRLSIESRVMVSGA